MLSMKILAGMVAVTNRHKNKEAETEFLYEGK